MKIMNLRCAIIANSPVIRIATDKGGRGFDLAGGEIEDRSMLGAFDQVLHHQPAGRMHIFVGAQPVSAKTGVFVVAKDRKAARGVVKAQRVPGVDVGSGTAVGPVLRDLLQMACGL